MKTSKEDIYKILDVLRVDLKNDPDLYDDLFDIMYVNGKNEYEIFAIILNFLKNERFLFPFCKAFSVDGSQCLVHDVTPWFQSKYHPAAGIGRKLEDKFLKMISNIPQNEKFQEIARFLLDKRDKFKHSAVSKAMIEIITNREFIPAYEASHGNETLEFAPSYRQSKNGGGLRRRIY